VSNKLERFLFQTANDWKSTNVPEEDEALLMDGANLEQAMSERKRVNLCLAMFGGCNLWSLAQRCFLNFSFFSSVSMVSGTLL
jgi:hypothetical protein